MQLSRARVVVLSTFALLFTAGVAHADSGIGTTTTFFHESGGPLDMTVVTPQAHISGDFADSLIVDANYEADIVTGASVAVVDAPSASVDVISSATVLDDIRHTFGGSLTFLGESTTLSGGYTYGFEKDYRSHGMALNARTEVLERNTAFDVSYARGWDSVCVLEQPRNTEAVDRLRLPDAVGCFQENDERDAVDLDIQTFQTGWTQAWTPVITTQLTLTAQLLDGYQGNPYRGVWLGRAAAAENHPQTRARYAAGLGLRVWIKPLRGAALGNVRFYRDTWDIESVTAELAYDQSIAAGLRVRGRVRYYTQTGAAFYSDDYTRFPRGQYFTGDRELSDMSSVTFGGRLAFEVPGDEDGDVLGFLGGLELVGKADFVFNSFDDYHYGAAEVPNSTAIVGTFGVEATF